MWEWECSTWLQAVLDTDSVLVVVAVSTMSRSDDTVSIDGGGSEISHRDSVGRMPVIRVRTGCK